MNMKMTRPSCATTRRYGPHVRAGTAASVRSPGSCPSSDGPSAMPARISPTTGGWRSRRNSAPISRATTTMMAMSRKTSAAISSGVWCGTATPSQRPRARSAERDASAAARSSRLGSKRLRSGRSDAACCRHADAAARCRPDPGSDVDGIADYTFVRPLGKGSHGVLYVAVPPPRLGLDVEHVAVKVLAGGTDEDAFRRTTRELRAFAAAQSPYLVTLFDAGQQERLVLLLDGVLPARLAGATRRSRCRARRS